MKMTFQTRLSLNSNFNGRRRLEKELLFPCIYLPKDCKVQICLVFCYRNEAEKNLGLIFTRIFKVFPNCQSSNLGKLSKYKLSLILPGLGAIACL